MIIKFKQTGCEESEFEITANSVEFSWGGLYVAGWCPPIAIFNQDENTWEFCKNKEMIKQFNLPQGVGIYDVEIVEDKQEDAAKEILIGIGQICMVILGIVSFSLL